MVATQLPHATHVHLLIELEFLLRSYEYKKRHLTQASLQGAAFHILQQKEHIKTKRTRGWFFS